MKINIYLLLIVFLLLVSKRSLGQEEDPRWKLTEPIEAEIERYISSTIKTYQLSKDEIKKLIEDLEHDNIPSSKKDDYILQIKKSKLRKDFFKENPEKIQAYLPKNTDNTSRQLNCNNEGFEQDGLNDYVIYTQDNWDHTGVASVNIDNLFTAGFTPFLVPNFIPFNDPNTVISHVYPGPVTRGNVTLPFDQVFAGTRSLRLNPEDNNTENATMLTTSFTVNQPFLSINFAAVFDNPNHGGDGPGGDSNYNPFILFEVFDTVTNEVVARRGINSVNSEGILTQVETGNIRFVPWSCLNLNINESLGHQVILKVLVSDCSAQVHDATIYLDDICNLGQACTDSLFGSLFLDPQGANCPDQPFQVCGSYIAPSLAVGNPTLSLDIVDSNNNTITTLTNGIIDTTNDTFCFTVNPIDFGSAPTGDYEFNLTGTFANNAGTPIIIDVNSANTGADISFNNCPSQCLTAGEDVSITFCNNDTTDYNLADYLSGADAGGIWSNPYTDGIFNPLLDANSDVVTIIYTIPSIDDCERDASTITITIDQCTDSCAVEDLVATVSGNVLQWPDITDGEYFIEFMASDDCPNGDSGAMTEFSYQQFENFIDLNSVVNDLGRKCFRYRIKTDCSEWTDWCLIGTRSTVMEPPFNLYDDCIPSNPCDDYEDTISITANVLSGTTMNYETYINITANNTIENGANSTYKAASSVSLLPEFHAVNGSYFRAHIEECSESLLRSSTILETENVSNNLSVDAIAIFPNPASNEINILSNTQKLYGYELYNMQGQLIKSRSNIEDDRILIHVQEMNRGFYLLRIILEDHTTINKTVILK